MRAGDDGGRRLTKRAVDSLRADHRDALLWDAELPGFGARCRPSGGKFYILKYRIGGRQRWYTIGRHGAPWTVEEARREARRLLGEVAAGRDPAERKAEARRGLTVAALCDLYVAEGCATKKPSTLATDRGRIERHIKPLLGRNPVRAVTRGDIERFMLDVANGKTAADLKTGHRGRAIVRGGRGTATKAVTLLGAIFSFAVHHGLRPDNPAHGVRTFKSRRCERFLSAAELARLGDALATAERDGDNPSAIAALRLLALTGCRKTEILSLRWGYIDWARACLRLPDSKTDAKVVPLGAPALELLRALPHLEGNPYVVPGGRAGGHYVGLAKVWRRVRARAGLADVRLHDLRHSFASVGAAGGDSLLVIGRLLGHANASTSARYAHLADDPLRAAADRIAGQIAAAMKGEGGGEVVELGDRASRAAHG